MKTDSKEFIISSPVFTWKRILDYLPSQNSKSQKYFKLFDGFNDIVTEKEPKIAFIIHNNYESQ